jgi:hypothetical protein
MIPMLLMALVVGCGVYLISRSAFEGVNHRNWLILIVLSMAGASLALRAAVPLIPLWHSPHDDELLIRQASAILEGEWLGDWTYFTLLKGPGYALFAAACRYFFITPVLGVQCLYLVASAMLMCTLRKVGIASWLVVVVFVVLALNPAYLGDSASRLYRDPLLGAFGLLAVSMVLWLSRSGLTLRHSLSARIVGAGWCLVLGVTIGFDYITKSDSVYWLVPTLLVVYVATVRSPGGVRRFSLQRLVPPLVGLAGVVVGFVAVIGAVAALNQQYYSYLGVEDLKTGGEQAVWRAWTGVDAGRNPRFVSISARQRDMVYAVSPSARKLRRILDNPFGWKALSCQALGVCSESTVWQEMELRDAVHMAGVGSAKEFQGLLLQTASEIHKACDSSRIPCRTGSPVVGLPAPADLRLAPVPRRFWELVLDDLGFVTGIATYRDSPSVPEGLDFSIRRSWERAVVDVDNGPLGINALQVRSHSAIAVVQTLRRVYAGGIWVVLLAGAFGCLVTLARPKIRWQRIMLPAGFLLAPLLSLASIAVLDQNMGVLGGGGNLYFIPTTPFLLVGALLSLRMVPVGRCKI